MPLISDGLMKKFVFVICAVRSSQHTTGLFGLFSQTTFLFFCEIFVWVLIGHFQPRTEIYDIITALCLLMFFSIG